MKFDFLGSLSKMLKSKKRQDPDPPKTKKGQISQEKPFRNGSSSGKGSTHRSVPAKESPQPDRAIIQPDSHLKQTPTDDASFYGYTGTVSSPPYRGTSPATDRQAVRNHADISVSMRTLGRKNALSEITIATDDGLVVATSAGRDVEFDAVHYSQVVQLTASPSEPDVTLFEVNHRGSHLIGIIRATHHISPVQIEQIRDDTKVILQWWL